MKTLILITQLIIGVTLFGQGNLQFNKAVHTEISCVNASGNQSGVIGATVSVVVPVGKTLKITSSSLEGSYTSTGALNPNINGKLILNNSVISFFHYNNPIFTNSDRFPIWLSSGGIYFKT